MSMSLSNNAISVLKTLKTVSDSANIPYLSGVASVVLVCVEAAKNARTNEEDAFELVERVTRLLHPTINRIHEITLTGSVVSESLLNDLKSLLPVFEKVASTMKKVTRRNFLARAVRSVSDKELIHQQNLALDHALQEFSVTSLMRLQVTSAVETDDYEKLKQTDIQLLEEVACPTDGPYLRIHRARIRSNGTVVRVLQHNDTVSVSEFLADLRRYQKMFHPNVEQLLGASPRTAPTKFVVVEDYPHQVDEILLSNPCALSLHERVRLALKAMTDILSASVYIYKLAHVVDTGSWAEQFRFDASLTKAVIAGHTARPSDPSLSIQTIPIARFKVFNLFSLMRQSVEGGLLPGQRTDQDRFLKLLQPLFEVEMLTFNSPSHLAVHELGKKLASAREEWVSTASKLAPTKSDPLPSLRTALVPHVHISYQTAIIHNRRHLFQPGDVGYFDGPLRPSAWPGYWIHPENNGFNLLCNIAEDLRDSCDLGDAFVVENSMHPRAPPAFDYVDGHFRRSYEVSPTSGDWHDSLLAHTFYRKCLHAMTNHAARKRVQTYLRDNLQDVLVDRADEGPRLGTREFGRRNVFIVTAVSEQRYANIELSRQSKSKRAVERGRFFFHEDEIDAIDTDWGYWSEHPQWMSREDRSKYAISSQSKNNSEDTMTPGGYKAEAHVDGTPLQHHCLFALMEDILC